MLRIGFQFWLLALNASPLFVQKALLPVIEIVPLAEIAPSAIETLLDAAFEPGRKQRTSYRIRGNTPWLPALSFAARDAQGRFCGQIQCTRVGLTSDGVVHALTFIGPLAVLPSHQGRGVGRALMGAVMAAAERRQPDTNAFAVIGDPGFFARLFGFDAALTTGWEGPGPVERQRLLAKVSRAGGLPRHGTLAAIDPHVPPFALASTSA